MKCKLLSLESMTSYCLKRGKSEVTCWSMNPVEHYVTVHYRYILLLVGTILTFYCLAHALLYSFYAFPLVRTSSYREERMQVEVLVLERTSMFHHKLFQIVWV